MDPRHLTRLFRTLAVCLTALFLAIGVAACGDDDDSASSSETVTVTESDTAATDTDTTDTDSSDTDSTDTESGGSEEDEVNAQAAADALLLGLRDDDPNIVCGLLSEDYANQLTGQKKFGIAKCVEALRKADLSSARSKVKGVEVRETVLKDGGGAATVTFSNGETLNLIKDPKDEGRYVITGGLD